MKIKKKSSKKTAAKPERFAIIANKSYGLYAGVVESISGDADGLMRVEVSQCRHVAHWRGKTGGITSLAAHGLCGPNAGESRIGAPVRATLGGVVNIFDCSPEARASIEASVPK